MTDRFTRGTVNPDQLDRDQLLNRIKDLERALDERDRAIAELKTLIPNSRGNGAGVKSGAGAARPAASPPAAGQTIATPPGADFLIVFDGGAIGNPGKGYGSYLIADRTGTVVAGTKLTHGQNMTNNAAEFLTLIAALERLLADLGGAAATSRIAIRGDSQLVINGVTGAWKIKHENLKPMRERVVSLLRGFGNVDIRWHDRANSVQLLGH